MNAILHFFTIWFIVAIPASLLIGAFLSMSRHSQELAPQFLSPKGE